MPRWCKEHKDKLAQMRELLGSQLTDRPQFPEVIGDRRLMRFLRGHEYDVEKATSMMAKFLTWRKENNIDDIRQNIISGRCNKPKLFPKGDIITQYMKSIAITPFHCDKLNHPIVVDQYDFSPTELRAALDGPEDYLNFLIYVLEYRSIIIEQLSHEREQAYLNSLTEAERMAALDESIEYEEEPKPEESGGFASYFFGGTTETTEASIKPHYLKPYAVLVEYIVIRDLGGLGLEHVGADGRDIITSVISVSSDNYPELMYKTYCINTPWLFSTLWWFIQSMISARTVAKVSVLGYDFRESMDAEIDPANLPSIIGGQLEWDPEYEFPFNLEYFN